jgi:hypothetical protein
MKSVYDIGGMPHRILRAKAQHHTVFRALSVHKHAQPKCHRYVMSTWLDFA